MIRFQLLKQKAIQSFIALKCKLWKTPDLYFLHIGKTGGTYIKSQVIGNSDYLQGSRKVGILEHLARNYRIIPLKHRQSQLQNFRPGEDLIACWIRDPIQRMHSAFDFAKNREHTMYAWSPINEKTSELIAKFDDFKDFIKRLVEHADPDAEELLDSVDHFGANYEFYFDSVNEMKRYESNFLFVGQMEQMISSVELFCFITNSKYEQIGNSSINKTPTKYRSAPIQGPLLNAARGYFRKEYEIYNFLLVISNRKMREHHKEY